MGGDSSAREMCANDAMMTPSVASRGGGSGGSGGSGAELS